MIIIITYKLYNDDSNDDSNNDSNHDNTINNNYIENFESVLSKLKKKNNNNNDTKKKNKNKNNNTKKSVTFDEMVSKSEKFAKEKDDLESITDALSKYKKVFNAKKFKNDSKSTAESFEKFHFYKEKLFELFK